MKELRYILKSMRPRQWSKNVFLFAALVFDRQLFTLESFLVTFLAFILFCLTSSLVYIINDLVDIEKDQQHPIKRERPLASGKLSKRTAIIAAVVLFLLIFPAAFILDLGFGLIISSYLILMLAYSLWLKHMPLIDVMIIAVGFVLRVAAGLVIIETERFSPWLFVITTFLALLSSLKRNAFPPGCSLSRHSWRCLSAWENVEQKSIFLNPTRVHIAVFSMAILWTC